MCSGDGEVCLRTKSASSRRGNKSHEERIALPCGGWRQTLCGIVRRRRVRGGKRFEGIAGTMLCTGADEVVGRLGGRGDAKEIDRSLARSGNRV